MQSYIFPLLILVQMFLVTPTPNKHTLLIKTLRQKKSSNYPFQAYHQILVPNLQVIPIHGNHWEEPHNISQHGPILVPIHNLVPIHELVPVNRLSVVPLQRVDEYKYHDDERYRNPLGGYGVGWRFGGHGAGHGFHYSFG